MRSRRPAIDHSEAVARRLAMLSAELDAARAEEARAAHPDVVDAGLTRVSGMPEPQALYEQEPLREAPEVSPGPTAVPEAAAPLPVAGRHAARRRAALGATDEEHPWARFVPAGLRGWQPGQMAVVLAGLLLATALACGWLLLGRVGTESLEVTTVAGRPASASVTPSEGPSGPAGGAPGDEASGRGQAPATGSQPVTPQEGQQGQVVVDVAGKVRRPGLVVLPAGSRVADALERAGGVRKGTDTTGLNLARVLVDGEQILVGVAPPAGQAQPPAGTASSAPAPGALVSINTADQTLLESLPGVGPVTAAAIVEWRTAHGGFSALADLLEVRGIGEATLARLTPHITL